MPQQCPECARFLSKAFIEGLSTAPAPCPKCASVLTAETFAAGGVVDTAAPQPPPAASRPDATPDAPAGTADVSASARPADGPAVRPPDLPAADVGPQPAVARDVLAGWDRDDDVIDMARWRREHRGLAPEALAVIAAGAAALGAAAGATMARGSRSRSAFFGVVLAAVVGVVAGSRMRR